jgi:phage baseplate assembly protein W
MAISFKNVGRTQQQADAEKQTITATPVGIKTPLRYGTNEGLFAMTYDFADQVGDNLRNLILTNRGERLGICDFGADLRSILSEYDTQDNFDTLAIEKIKTSVERWMPYVDLVDYESRVEKTKNNASLVILTIRYNVQALNLKDKKIEVSLYVMLQIYIGVQA